MNCIPTIHFTNPEESVIMGPSFQMTDDQFRKFLFDCLVDLQATSLVYGELARKMRAEQMRVREEEVAAELSEAKEKYRIDLQVHYLNRYAE